MGCRVDSRTSHQSTCSGWLLGPWRLWMRSRSRMAGTSAWVHCLQTPAAGGRWKGYSPLDLRTHRGTAVTPLQPSDTQHTWPWSFNLKREHLVPGLALWDAVIRNDLTLQKQPSDSKQRTVHGPLISDNGHLVGHYALHICTEIYFLYLDIYFFILFNTYYSSSWALYSVGQSWNSF